MFFLDDKRTTPLLEKFAKILCYLQWAKVQQLYKIGAFISVSQIGNKKAQNKDLLLLLYLNCLRMIYYLVLCKCRCIFFSHSLPERFKLFILFHMIEFLKLLCHRYKKKKIFKLVRSIGDPCFH